MPLFSFLEYQNKSARTMNRLEFHEALSNWCMGLSGEVGEITEHIKKHLYHGKKLDYGEVEKEIGDLLWYVSALCSSLGFSLEDVAKGNIKKLEARYPQGFKGAYDIKDFLSDVPVASHQPHKKANKDQPENDNHQILSVAVPVGKLDVWQVPTEDD